jgi:hypothetical protein
MIALAVAVFVGMFTLIRRRRARALSQWLAALDAYADRQLDYWQGANT